MKRFLALFCYIIIVPIMILIFSSFESEEEKDLGKKFEGNFL